MGDQQGESVLFAGSFSFEIQDGCNICLYYFIHIFLEIALETYREQG